MERMVTSTVPVNNLVPAGIVSDQMTSVYIVVVLLEYGIGVPSDMLVYIQSCAT